MVKTKTPAAPKPPKKSAPSGLSIAQVMLIAEIRAMTQPARITRFGECATVSQRAFAEMGKLRRAIEADLKDGQDFTNTMRKQGIRDGTISNSSYAARVFDLVEAGHITEKQYDAFSFSDCVSIVRVMGPQSKNRFAGPEVAVVLASSPENFDEEFACIYEHGMCLAEKAAADQAAADLAKKQQEKALADQAAADLLKEQQAQQPAPAPAPTTPVPDGSIETGVAPEQPPAPAASASGAEPTNIIPGPGAPAPQAAKPIASKLGQTMNLIDTLELLFADLSVEDARKAAPRLMELADTVCNYIAEPGDVAVPQGKKQKKAA
jgi:hypothetical protein